MQRISKEHNILRNSLPEGILARAFEDRMDLLRVLILGPTNTPYVINLFIYFRVLQRIIIYYSLL